MPKIKKKITIKEKAIKAPKIAETKSGVPTEDSRVAKYRKLLAEATTPEKVLEYRFWMETYQGKNPPIPSHMR